MTGRVLMRSSICRGIMDRSCSLTFRPLVAEVTQKVAESDDAHAMCASFIAEHFERLGNLQARGNFARIGHVSDLRNSADDYELRLLGDTRTPVIRDAAADAQDSVFVDLVV